MTILVAAQCMAMAAKGAAKGACRVESEGERMGERRRADIGGAVSTAVAQRRVRGLQLRVRVGGGAGCRVVLAAQADRTQTSDGELRTRTE